MAAASPRPSHRCFTASLWVHRWTGLIATPFFFVLCLTGSVLIFHEEIDRLVGDRPPSGAAPSALASFDDLAATALRGTAGERVMYIGLTPDEPAHVFLGVGAPTAIRLDQGSRFLLSRRWQARAATHLRVIPNAVCCKSLGLFLC